MQRNSKANFAPPAVRKSESKDLLVNQLQETTL